MHHMWCLYLSAACYHVGRLEYCVGRVVDLPALVEGVFQAARDSVWHRLMVASLGGVVSVLIVAGLRKLWRRWIGYSAKRQTVARVLSDQGEYHAQLKHRHEAMELYDLSVQLDPKEGHVYYLRGCLHAEMGDPNRAVADWRRCLAQLPRHPDAERRLTELGAKTQSFVRPWAYVCGVTAVLLLVILVGFAG